MSQASGSGRTRPPPLGGVLETALYVHDLARASHFYQEALGLKRIFADERLAAYEAGPASVLLLFRRGTTLGTVTLPGGTIPPHDGHGPVHIAFAVTREAVSDWERHLAAQGINVEGRTHWPKGSDSLYFRDPDGHLLELATPGLWPNY